tara:strand:- start:678 stop:1541 length:864 start_codon:yes stop_codon:yes gene_type:complete
MVYIGTSPSNGVRRKFTYDATSGQTSFSGNDENSVTLTYVDSFYLDVYQNGVKLKAGDDYTATTGTSVVLATGAATNDVIEIIAFDIFSVGDTVSAKDGGNFGGDISSNGNAVKVAGKESMWIPALAMKPTVSNGCAAHASVETTAGRPDMIVLDFDKDSDEFAQFAVAFPKSWNAGTVTFQFYWSGIAATTGVAMSLQGVAFADNDSIDTVYGTAIVVQDDAQGAVEEMLVSPESSAITIAGSPGASELTYFRIGRDVSDSNDDMAGDCRLHGIKLFFSTNAKNDE